MTGEDCDCAEDWTCAEHRKPNFIFSKVTKLPDGSGFFTGTLPLPEDHWVYEDRGEPPILFQTGTSDPDRKRYEDGIRKVLQYAIKASTMNGKEMEFDPDALVQNVIIGFLGYNTPDGKSNL
jgi:hypothetical protein